MKSNSTRLIFLVLILSAFSITANGQDGYWKFKEIIHANHFGSTNLPDKIELDVNEGVVEFSIRQVNNCTDRYRFTYTFLQDMNTLETPVDRKTLPSYGFEFKITPLGPPCYDPNARGYSNPRVWMTHWNAPSGVLGNMKKAKTWKYRYHQQFINNNTIEHYAHKANAIKASGKGYGEYNVTGPNKKDVEYNLKNYAGMATDFRILFKGQSSLGKSEAFYYDILFMYELTGGTPVSNEAPCDIEPPDCSCCPGTIPVWNFQSNKGDCICPEGKIWDKIQNMCIKT